MKAIHESRPRRTLGRSSRARSASTGEMWAAASAGSMAARIVIPMPTAARRDGPGRRRTAVTVATTPVASLTAPAMTHGEDRADQHAEAAPRRPRSSAPLKTNRLSWARVAPAARSSPTSRARSPTVIESVLTIRNAPTNRTIAATSAAVPWKAAEEARRLRADVGGRGEHVGLGHPGRELARDGGQRIPGASWRSTRVAPVSPKVERATSIGTTTVRPVPAIGPKPGRMPTTRSSTYVPPAPSSVSWLPRP